MKLLVLSWFDDKKQKVPHKSVYVAPKVPHKSVLIIQKVPHKNVIYFAISLIFSIFARNIAFFKFRIFD